MNRDTFFAPGPRDPLSVVVDEADQFAVAQIGQQILDSIPDIAIVLNDKRQIVAANAHCVTALGLKSVEELYGRRVGEAVGCIHADQGPNGCGTSVACQQCGAAKAILNSSSTHRTVQKECRITAQRARGEFPLEYLAKASFVTVGDLPLVLLVLRDISSENRKKVLERLFFHDVLNSVGGIIGLADLMVSDTPAEATEYASIIQRLAESVADEISSFAKIVEAESGTLKLSIENVCLAEVFADVAESTARNPACCGRQIRVEVDPDCCFRTDSMLVRRVVTNLMKNAAEASKSGDWITLSAALAGDNVTIQVCNPGFIPMHIQSQLFKRSFSTKGEVGRGIGTYSIKLFAERYLNGRVEFTSSQEEGTTFTVTLPSL